MEFLDKVCNIFSKNGINLTENQAKMFQKYYEMLVETNKVMNLTSITDEDEVIVKHFLDSCMGTRFLTENANVLDVGCGAGFPSVPLKILRPDLKCVLVDSVDKKLKFVKSVIQELDLTSIETIHTRIEDYVKQGGEKFDYVVCRAVAPLPTLLEYSIPFLKIGGEMIAYKGQNYEEEVNQSKNALTTLSSNIKCVETCMLQDNFRSILIIEKMEKTSIKYPRPKNLPRTNPL